MLEIIPSVLTSSLKELEDMLAQAEGVVERVQIDIVDGQFAKNKTIDPSSLAEIETNLKLDFHLMVKEPINWVEKCAGSGADRIIGQIEMMRDQIDFVAKVQEVGASVGLAIDIDTPASELDPVILTSLDVVLVMSVPAGFGGQKFDERALDKIKRLGEIRKKGKTPFKIMDDGGITLGKIDDTRRVGVDEVVIGQRVFQGDIAQNIERFRKAAYNRFD